MTIERQHGVIIFMCDECEDEFETGEKEFNEALSLVKEEGWLIQKDDDGEWQHICTKCCS